MRFLLTLILLFIINLTYPANAKTSDEAGVEASPENIWKLKPFSIYFHGNAIKKDVRYVPFEGELLYTSDSNRPGLALMCIRGKLLATASVEPTDLSQLISTDSRRYKSHRVKLYIDDKEVDNSKWVYKPTLKLISPPNKSSKRLAATMYNAVVQRQKLVIDMSSRDSTEIDLPIVNQAFAIFGAECGIGNRKKS